MFLNNFGRFRDLVLPWFAAPVYKQGSSIRRRTLMSLLIYSLVIFCLQIWMIPALISAVLLYSYSRQLLFSSKLARTPTQERVSFYHDPVAENFPSEDQTDFGFLKQIRAISVQILFIQEQLQYCVDLCEKARNLITYNGSPYLSHLALAALTVSTVVLYFVPVRWILWIYAMFLHAEWYRKPGYALLDFISRVPTNAEICTYRQPPVRVRGRTRD